MQLLFILISVLILLVVIFIAAKPVIEGIKARSNLNREKDKQKEKEENISQDEEILDKLKDKNLSPEDLKKIYEDLQKKK
tara:strand:+ start:116 stop:355 length:240 start_codon:yes stop_codon:yes gene_type:complete